MAQGVDVTFLFDIDWNGVDKTVSLPSTQAHHALRVLRLPDGAQVSLLNGKGALGCGILSVLNKKEVNVQLESVQRLSQPAHSIEIAAAVPKGDRQNQMIERLVQLGCNCLQPIVFERSVVNVKAEKIVKWQRCADETLKQCGRTWRLEILPPMSLQTYLAKCAEAPDKLSLLADPNGQKTAFTLPLEQSVRVLIGPEGGLSDTESQCAIEAGWLKWRYADAILRIETAAELATGILAYKGF